MASTSTLLVVFGVLFLGGWLLRRASLPKPIPGIPYNRESAKRIFGDVPDALNHTKETGEVISFINKNAEKFGTPVFQIFMRPFLGPWVIVTDFREAQDIVARRTREFDRSGFFGDLFVSMLPGSMVHMPTGDTWRGQRRLVGDTMTPAFLNNVAGPQVYKAAESLIGLWREKARLSQGRPFSASGDVYNSALDAIWAAAFGSEVGTTKTQLDLLSKMDHLSKLPGSKDAEVGFPEAGHPETFESVHTLTKSFGIALASPFPRIHHWLALNFFPYLVKAGKHKEQLISEKIDEALGKVSTSETEIDDDRIKSALDLTIQREMLRAKKEGRTPDWKSMYIKDELFAFLIAGHETTATTVAWGLKNLTDNQDVQKKLRSVLHSEFSEAYAAGHPPGAQELSKARIPYVDAVLEEILRLSGTSSATNRVSTVDTQILGHPIPKGTEIWLLTQGPSFTRPALDVDEKLRTQTGRDSKDKNGAWDPSDVSKFVPERWLKKNEKGEEEFDSRAGPTMPFGGGPRGCFGRKLAEMELKIMIVLIVWSFRLESTPPELSTYTGVDILTHTPRQCYLRLSPI